MALFQQPGRQSGPETGGHPRWVSAGATHQGRVRSINQDAFLDRPELGLWAVADGMGGHAEGAHASHAIIDALAALPHSKLLGRRAWAIMTALQHVNRDLLGYAAAMETDLVGSTVVAVAAVREHAAILWTGDSRLYRLRDGRLACLTTDHSQVQLLVDQGLLSPDMAESHPSANVLLWAVGSEEDLRMDYRLERLQCGDRLLLCSDGLYRELNGAAMADLLGGAEPARIAPELVRQACAQGGRDNVTAVVVSL
ncbi:MAG: SpoIIE family protein phosphatase [Gammaproteobacteria bacterium]|jgi:protein phosphatase|nr:SpoIIE family protein phosphatase [Gammaproteobacteria bacterium]